MISLGQRIRELRLSKGLTQVSLAKDLCTPSMVSQIESDRARPSYKMLFSIAERLDTTVENLITDAGMDLDHQSTFKMARAMIGAKDFATAIPILKELLGAKRAQVSTLDIQLELGECLLYVGEGKEAEKTLQEVVELSVMRQDKQKLARAFKLLGDLEYRRKRYTLAAFHWQKGLERAEEMPEQDVYLNAEILHLLGSVYVKMGEAQEAEALYKRAAELYEGAESLNEIGQVYLGLSKSYKMMDELEQSVEYAERAIGIFKGIENQVMMLQNQVTCAVTFGETGREIEAESLLKDAVQQFAKLGKEVERGIALVEFAKLMIHLERWPEAEEACLRAQNLLPELHIYQAWVNRLRAQIDLTRDQKSSAICHFQSAADAFLRQRELAAYSDTMYELSCVYRQANDYHRAFQLMDQVRTQTHGELQKRGIVL